MKATGIIRRIDDLGRVVIPKEIRRIYGLREGTSMEIYTASDGQVVFKKYLVDGEVIEHANSFIDLLGTANIDQTEKDNMINQVNAMIRVLEIEDAKDHDF